MENLVNEVEASKLLGMSVATLRRWRWAGRGPTYSKIGAAVRYSPNELAAYVKRCSRRSTSDPGPAAAS